MSVIQQDIFSGSQYPRTLTIQQVSAKDAACQLAKFLAEPGTEDIVPVGIAYYSRGKSDFMYLAQSNTSDVLSFSLGLGKSKSGSIADFLCAEGSSGHPLASKVTLVGFGMAQIAIQICHASNLRVKGVDLLDLFHEPISPSDFVVKMVDNNAKKFVVQRLWMSTRASAQKDAALRAWLAACAGDRCKTNLMNAVKLDTGYLSFSELDCLSQLVAQSALLEKLKPREVQNEFSKAGLDKQGKFYVRNERFKSRVRPSEQTRVILTDENNRRFEGTAIVAKGKTTTITFRKGKAPSGNLRTVKVVGLPEPTNSERARDELVNLVLAAKKSLQESSFVQRLWFPDIVGQTMSTTVNPHQPESIIESMKLNDSQCTAISAMVGESPIVIVHGPPGTGKTTTITAAARIWEFRRSSVWIVAHSNVAVKNIAEKLFDTGVDFKILVSKEFYVEWHEHMYQAIEEKLYRSDELPKDPVAMARLILDSKVILCTLSMMLNPILRSNGTFDIVPPRCLVIDEASQINAFEFMPIFDTFRKNIEKVCFFGDPLQLPPFGHDDVPEMKTIFDFKRLNAKKDTYFLNTQYRMPNPIAKFISDNVYEGRLLSQHDIVDPNCLALIDVARTGEQSAGTSTKNTGEVDTVVHLVRYYYRELDFCVITPYDAQRAAIQKALETEKLPCDTVYNVDSFQGNEAKYVIVSLVRSSSPGFLQSIQRMNVMLTRCRRGLIIVSSQGFLGPGGKGSDTLLGRLVQHWENEYRQSWIDWRSVANASVNLPGAMTHVSLNTSTGSRPPVNTEPHRKTSSKGNSVTSSVVPAQGQKNSKSRRKSIALNATSQKQPQQTKDPKEKQSNSRKSTKARG